jgi:hypothetical protein
MWSLFEPDTNQNVARICIITAAVHMYPRISEFSVCTVTRQISALCALYISAFKGTFALHDTQ